jgi:hypothetical protein
VTSENRVGSPVASVRAVGDLALFVSGVLLFADLLSPRWQVGLASIILVIAGVGLRIEAAIRDRNTAANPSDCLPLAGSSSPPSSHPEG